MLKLTLPLLALVLLTTIGLGQAFDLIYERYLSPKTARVDTVQHLQTIGALWASGLDRTGEASPFASPSKVQQGQYSGSVVPVQDISVSPTLMQALRSGSPMVIEGSNEMSFYYYLKNADKLFVLKTPLLAAPRTEGHVHMAATGLFYLILLAIVFFWAWPLSIRLKALRSAAIEFGSGNFARRIKTSPASYIHDVEVEFNRMAQRIDNLIDDVKILSSSISHELRTPLAKLRFGLDALQEENDPTVRATYWQRLAKTTDEMTSMVEATIHYARLDYSMMKMSKRSMSISQCVRGCLDKNVSASFEFVFSHPERDFIVLGDPHYLSILIDNLLSNASKYGKSKAEIHLREVDDRVLLTIGDDGNGIDEAQLDKLFEPFVRGHTTKVENDGFGMGLAIAKKIAQWHGTSLSVSSSELGGAEFSIMLPKR